MPVNTGREQGKCYARWGSKGKKYYYKCSDPKAKARAEASALRQGRAIKASDK